MINTNYNVYFFLHCRDIGQLCNAKTGLKTFVTVTSAFLFCMTPTMELNMGTFVKCTPSILLSIRRVSAECLKNAGRVSSVTPKLAGFLNPKPMKVTVYTTVD